LVLVFRSNVLLGRVETELPAIDKTVVDFRVLVSDINHVRTAEILLIEF